MVMLVRRPDWTGNGGTRTGEATSRTCDDVILLFIRYITIFHSHTYNSWDHFQLIRALHLVSFISPSHGNTPASYRRVSSAPGHTSESPAGSLPRWGDVPRPRGSLAVRSSARHRFPAVDSRYLALFAVAFFGTASAKRPDRLEGEGLLVLLRSQCPPWRRLRALRARADRCWVGVQTGHWPGCPWLATEAR